MSGAAARPARHAAPAHHLQTLPHAHAAGHEDAKQPRSAQAGTSMNRILMLAIDHPSIHPIARGMIQSVFRPYTHDQLKLSKFVAVTFS